MTVVWWCYFQTELSVFRPTLLQNPVLQHLDTPVASVRNTKILHYHPTLTLTSRKIYHWSVSKGKLALFCEKHYKGKPTWMPFYTTKSFNLSLVTCIKKRLGTDKFCCLNELSSSCGGAVVSLLISRLSGLGSSLGRGHCVVFLGKTLNSDSQCLSPFSRVNGHQRM